MTLDHLKKQETCMAMKVFIKTIRGSIYSTQRSEIFIPLLGPKRSIPLQGPVPQLKTEKPAHLPKIETNTIEDNIIKGVRNTFILKTKTIQLKNRNRKNIRTILESEKRRSLRISKDF